MLDSANHQITATLVKKLGDYCFEDIPHDPLEVARQCILDWFGVTFGGMTEPLSGILKAHIEEEGGDGQATIFGYPKKGTVMQAALVNGATSHALDYDDVNQAYLGHPTAPVLPAVLALAEQLGSSGKEFINAFVAGYEIGCRVGLFTGRNHYNVGFHGTATIGTFGATAGCAKLLELSPDKTAQAFGIAGTQAAGLKSMFGTMCKPLHAGKAAANGVLAAKLASRGFSSCAEVLETKQGFADTLRGEFNSEKALSDPDGGYFIRENLFKYHAACYLTHASIEALSTLRKENDLKPDDIDTVTLTVEPGSLTVCNIQEPQTGLECKFSLRQTSALALSGEDTGALEVYSDANALRSDLAQLRNKVKVVPEGKDRLITDVHVRLKDGRELNRSHDAGIPAASIDAQGDRIKTKFLTLANATVGAEKAKQILDAIDNLENMENITELTAICSN